MATTELTQVLETLEVRFATIESKVQEIGGECQVGSVGLATLRPVMDEDGLRWCCSHEQEHCSETVAEYKK